MGVSTDAILFYGYCWTKETDRPWTIGQEEAEGDPEEDEEDWVDRYVRAMGSSADTWAEKRALVTSSGCEVSTHCSNECPMPFVAVTASLVRSWRGHMEEVKSLAVDPAWDKLLSEFCEVLGIRTEGLRAAWWLVSDWS